MGLSLWRGTWQKEEGAFLSAHPLCKDMAWLKCSVFWRLRWGSTVKGWAEIPNLIQDKLAWAQPGFMSECTALSFCSMCDMPEQAHRLLLWVSLHHKTICCYKNISKTISIFFVSIEAESLFLGSWPHCGFLDTGGFKFAECPKSPLPIEPLQLLLKPLSSVCPGEGQNWRIKTKGFVVVKICRTAAQPLLMSQELFSFLKFGWLCAEARWTGMV